MSQEKLQTMVMQKFCGGNSGELWDCASSELDASSILTSNTKCPFKSKHFLHISNNKVRVKVSVIFSFG